MHSETLAPPDGYLLKMFVSSTTRYCDGPMVVGTVERVGTRRLGCLYAFSVCLGGLIPKRACHLVRIDAFGGGWM